MVGLDDISIARTRIAYERPYEALGMGAIKVVGGLWKPTAPPVAINSRLRLSLSPRRPTRHLKAPIPIYHIFQGSHCIGQHGSRSENHYPPTCFPGVPVVLDRLLGIGSLWRRVVWILWRGVGWAGHCSVEVEERTNSSFGSMFS